MTDELAALEWDFRRSLIRELQRVARTGDDSFFSVDQPRTRDGKATLLKLAEDIMAARERLKDPPSSQSAAAGFLLSCIRWNHANLEERISSAALARDLLADLQSDNDV